MWCRPQPSTPFPHSILSWWCCVQSYAPPTRHDCIRWVGSGSQCWSVGGKHMMNTRYMHAMLKQCTHMHTQSLFNSTHTKNFMRKKGGAPQPHGSDASVGGAASEARYDAVFFGLATHISPLSGKLKESGNKIPAPSGRGLPSFSAYPLDRFCGGYFAGR